MCHPERGLSQFHRERRSRRTWGMSVVPLHSGHFNRMFARTLTYPIGRYRLGNAFAPFYENCGHGEGPSANAANEETEPFVR